MEIVCVLVFRTNDFFPTFPEKQTINYFNVRNFIIVYSKLTQFVISFL